MIDLLHKRLAVPGLLLLFIAASFTACSSTKEITPMTESDILAFHNEILTIDTHVDTPLRFKHQGIDLGKRYDPREIRSQLDYPRMDEGGLDAAFFAVWTPQGARTDSAHAAIKAKALKIIESVNAMVGKYPDQGGMATHSSDALRMAKQGRHAIYLGLENGFPLGTDVDNIDQFYALGIRYVTLCHTSNNEICDSSNDTTEFGGLSPFGFQVVERMNKIGMMIDISHLSNAAVDDVLDHSAAPVIASHSGASAVYAHPRNLNDTLLLRIAEKGGVIQMNLFSGYIKQEPPNPGRDSAKAAFKEKWGDSYKLSDEDQVLYDLEKRDMNRQHPQILASVSEAIDHIDHMVDLIGIDHVGIGTDFDGGAGLADCYDVSELPNITKELFKRGYSKSDIQKIWSGNLLRVFEAVESIAISQ